MVGPLGQGNLFDDNLRNSQSLEQASWLVSNLVRSAWKRAISCTLDQIDNFCKEVGVELLKSRATWAFRFCHCSPLHPTTLSAATRAAAGIPKSAAHFAWAYPVPRAAFGFIIA